MKKFSILIAMLLVVALAVPTFANPFTDVPANHWAYEAVNKLVAAGIISGYPDGTYKGNKTLTRYEIAVVVSRALDNIAAEQEALADELDAAKAGLTTEQAQDVTAIVKALMEKNVPEVELPEGLTDQQAEEVANLIEALTFEFKAELMVIGAKIDVINTELADLDSRVAALENETPVVTFSGSYAVDFEHQVLDEGTATTDVDTDFYWFHDDVNDKTAAETAITNYLALDPDNEAADAIDNLVTAGTVNEETTESDPYVEVPWTDGEETITVNEDKGFSQTLTFATNINKDGFSATLDIDATEDEDEMAIDSIGLSLENDFVAATYNEANSVEFVDYAYSSKEFNGVNVDFKKYGVDAFFGVKEVESGEATATVEKEILDPDGFAVTAEKDVVKYEWDEDEGKFVAMKDTVDYYAYGAAKTFTLGGLDVDAKFAGERKADDKEVATNVFGFATGTELSGIDVSFDMAYSMDKASDTSDMLYRLGLSRDLDVAGVEFNYKNSGEEFVALDSDATVFDSGDDAYDLYTTGMAPGTSGWNLTVTPNVLENLDASFFYASVNDGDDNTKMALTGEMPVLIEGLVVNGKYETTKEAGDETKTMGFGAEYAFLADKATATFDYTTVDPVEDATDWITDNKEIEKTMTMGLDYTVNDYITASFSRESVTNLGHVAKFDGKDIEKTATTFGVDLADYPVFGALTASAGLNYTTVKGYEFSDADPTAVNPTETPSADSLEEKATELSLGLGYTLGAAELSYDLSNTKKEGEGVDDGNYTVHNLGLVYTITDNTDFTANYKIHKLTSDNGDLDEFTVKTATAGVSIDF